MTLRSDVVAALNGLPAPLTNKAFGDFAPDGEEPPYLTVLIDIGEVPVLSGDGKMRISERLFQVGLWELRIAETEALKRLVIVTLDGLAVPSSPTRLRFRSVDRVPDPDFGLAHRAFTFAATGRA